jgi:hypothetical protein
MLITMRIIRPIPKNLFLKLSILQSWLYCGVLWGLYHQGWAMTQQQDRVLFPFWLNRAQAEKYAQTYWPNYVPRQITAQDFNQMLLPTLARLNIQLALCSPNAKWCLKLNTAQMQHWFFSKKSPKTV